MLDLTIVSATPPSKAVASTPNGSPSGDFSRVLANADDSAPNEPDPAAAPITSKPDDADRQDVAADGKDVPDTDDETIDPALINLLFLAPVPAFPAPVATEQSSASAAPTAAVTAPASPIANPQTATAPSDTTASTDQPVNAAPLPALDPADAKPSPDILKALAGAKANADTAAPSTAASTATAAAPAPAQPVAPVIILPASNPAAAPIAVAANAAAAGGQIAVPIRRTDKTDQPSGQRAALVTPTLASLAGGLVDGPVIGLVQPAARAFASAIAATTAGLQHDPRDPAEDSASAVITQALGNTTHELTATVRDSTTLDTRGAQWREALVDHIETLRDAADARDTRIRLVPDALGKVDVAIRKDGDTVNVRFTTETPAARQLLVDARPQLAALAEARGLKIGQTSVDSGAHQNGAQGNAQQRAPDQPIQNRRPVRSDATATTEPAEADGWIA